MKQITEFTEDPNQQHVLIGENGEEITVNLVFIDSQTGWFIDLQYGDLIINSMRLVTSVNILHSWKNIIPFGLTVATPDKGDPYFIDDFTSGRVGIFLTNSGDRKELEEEFYGE